MALRDPSSTIPSNTVNPKPKLRAPRSIPTTYHGPELLLSSTLTTSGTGSGRTLRRPKARPSTLGSKMSRSCGVFVAKTWALVALRPRTCHGGSSIHLPLLLAMHEAEAQRPSAGHLRSGRCDRHRHHSAPRPCFCCPKCVGRRCLHCFKLNLPGSPRESEPQKIKRCRC